MYDKTRAALANKITLSSNNKNTNEVPDILTGATWGGVKRSEEGEDGSKSTLKIDPNVTTRSVNPFASYNIVQPELQKF